MSRVVVAWKPLDANHRTPDVIRLRATSPRSCPQSSADLSGKPGGTARPLPGPAPVRFPLIAVLLSLVAAGAALAATRGPVPLPSRWPERTLLSRLTMRLVTCSGCHPDRPGGLIERRHL